MTDDGDQAEPFGYARLGEPGSLVGTDRVDAEDPMTKPRSPAWTRTTRQARAHLPSWRREALRTNLWLVPTALVVAVVLLFAASYGLDRAVARGDLKLPSWIRRESVDAARQLLIAIAAAVLTVVGVVFSITILALTLASQQFGPRMLRNFIRDVGTQITLGAFVATFVYAVLVLGSINNGPGSGFVPNISISVALALLLVDIVILIYFIHHVAKSIQLPELIAGIARDLARAIDKEYPPRLGPPAGNGVTGPPVAELVTRLDEEGEVVPATTTGYLQFVGYSELVSIAAQAEAVIRLAYQPGHFVVAGHRLATVWPAAVSPQVATELARAHITGPHRTLAQDPVFAIDQLVEIAIRALSPALNDTFTALTCIDWLCDGLCRLSGRLLVDGVAVDRSGRIRLIEAVPGYGRFVNRAFDKIRQAGRGMPAVSIRLEQALARIMDYTVSADQREVLLRQAEMVLRSAVDAIPEEQDRADVRAAYDRVVTAAARRGTSAESRPSLGPAQYPLGVSRRLWGRSAPGGGR
jgi:uncharacterized membrane protein